jgi:hypothetical protein
LRHPFDVLDAVETQGRDFVGDAFFAQRSFFIDRRKTDELVADFTAGRPANDVFRLVVGRAAMYGYRLGDRVFRRVAEHDVDLEGLCIWRLSGQSHGRGKGRRQNTNHRADGGFDRNASRQSIAHESRLLEGHGVWKN